MNQAIVRLESMSPYSQSKHYEKEKRKDENDLDVERRTWRGRMSVTPDGIVFIPPMGLVNCVQEAARRRGEKIKGRGQRTWSKIFESGIMVTDPILLGIKADSVRCEELFVPSDGKRGGGKRVVRVFPMIEQWSADATIHLLSEEIPEAVFREHLEWAGMFVGLGRFRPERGGYYGRFRVSSFQWVEGAS